MKYLYKTTFFLTLLIIEFLATAIKSLEQIALSWNKLNHLAAFSVLYILFSLEFKQISVFLKLAFVKKLGDDKQKDSGDGSATDSLKWGKWRMLTQRTSSVVSVDGYKVSYFKDAFTKFCENKDNKYFVTIGHPKAMSKYSLKRLEEFIEKNKENNFLTYSKLFMDGKL